MKKPIKEWSGPYLSARLSRVGKNLEACRIAAERCRSGVAGYGPMAEIVADENLNLRLLEEIRDEVERREQLRRASDAKEPLPVSPGTASDAEPSEDEVERGIEQWFLGDDLSVMDDEMWDENRRAMRRVLSDFLTRRRSGGMGGNGNLKVLEGRVAALREWMREAKKGRDLWHRQSCGVIQTWGDPMPGTCTCGLESLLAEGEAEATENHSPESPSASSGGTGEVAPTSTGRAASSTEAPSSPRSRGRE